MISLALLLFIPLSLALKYTLGAGPIWLFVSGVIAVAVLADWVRKATEQLAERAGSAIGGLLNISFGSIAELVLALLGLAHGQAPVVKAQITDRSSEPACSAWGWRCWSAACGGCVRPLTVPRQAG